MVVNGSPYHQTSNLWPRGSLANELGNLVHRILTLLRKNLPKAAAFRVRKVILTMLRRRHLRWTWAPTSRIIQRSWQGGRGFCGPQFQLYFPALVELLQVHRDVRTKRPCSKTRFWRLP